MRTRSRSSLSARASRQAPCAAPRRSGQRHFGESYLQEALPKIRQLRDLPLTWHFIGRIQTNKTRAIAEQFDWVHGIDRLRIAERLAAQRPHHAPPLEACIQVNIGQEAGKAGVAADEAAGAGAGGPGAAAAAIARPHVHPAGGAGP